MARWDGLFDAGFWAREKTWSNWCLRVAALGWTNPSMSGGRNEAGIDRPFPIESTSKEI